MLIEPASAVGAVCNCYSAANNILQSFEPWDCRAALLVKTVDPAVMLTFGTPARIVSKHADLDVDQIVDTSQSGLAVAIGML